MCPFPPGAPGLAGKAEEQTEHPSTLIGARRGGLQGLREQRGGLQLQTPGEVERYLQGDE